MSLLDSWQWGGTWRTNPGVVLWNPSPCSHRDRTSHRLLPTSDWGLRQGRHGCPGDWVVLWQVTLAHQLCQTSLELHCTLRGFLPSHISPSQRSDPHHSLGALPASLQDPPHFPNRLMYVLSFSGNLNLPVDLPNSIFWRENELAGRCSINLFCPSISCLK